jgi:hypothetical protein
MYFSHRPLTRLALTADLAGIATRDFDRRAARLFARARSIIAASAQRFAR